MTASACAGIPRATGRRKGGTRRCVIAILTIGGIAIVMIAGLGWLGGFRINLTPSEPLGLWRIVPLGRPLAVGDLVFVCPPPGPISAFGLERGYFRQGLCPGGAAPLIKIVAASAGAHIGMTAEVTIDGATLPHSRLSIRDGAGRLLSPWGGGAVSPGQLFLHSAFAGSYDSRYFGPIPAKGILGLARPVPTFGP